MIFVTRIQVTFIAVVFLGPLNYHMSLYAKWDICERGFNFRIPSFIHLEHEGS